RGERSAALRDAGGGVLPDLAVLREPRDLLRDEPAVPRGAPAPGDAAGRVRDDAQECGRREDLLTRRYEQTIPNRAAPPDPGRAGDGAGRLPGRLEERRPARRRQP